MRRIRVPFVVLSAFLLLGSLLPVAPAGAGAGKRAASSRLQMYEAIVDPATAQTIVGGGYEVVTEKQLRSGDVRLVLVLTSQQARALGKLGVSLTLWRNDDGLTATKLAAEQKAAGYKVWRPYDGPGGMRAWMGKIVADNPDLLELEVLGTTAGTNPAGGSDTPRQIVAIRMTRSVSRVENGSRPAVLYSSLQHAREWISGEVTRRLLTWYLKKYRLGDSTVRGLLRSTELWFLIVANPDGYQYTFDGDRLWRKNLRDNDGDNVITTNDGVDPNRNFPEHWNYDDEGSATIFSDQTYRGPGPASEPETKAMIRIFGLADFRFQVNYHSFGELLLTSFGWQVQTPSADDPIYITLGGNDKQPAISGFDPGVGGDLYITNGETTDWAHAAGTIAWTPELSQGPNGDGFVFPDSRGAVRAEFRRNLPFARDVALSALDPDDPVSHLGNHTEPLYLDVSASDPQKANNPLSDFTFDYSYGDPQTVEVLAKRDIDGNGSQDPVTVHWRVNGGRERTAPTSEWMGGDRFGGPGDVYYRVMRGEVSGFDPGDRVRVWFSGRGATSDAFTFEVIEDAPARVLVMAAEDYSGPSNWPVYASSTAPNDLAYYTHALHANGIAYDVYDIDAMGRIAPDNLGVLSHYDAVIWYTANDYLTREPGQVPGTGASTLANTEVLQVRSYLNEGGRLLYTGVHAGWQYSNAFEYDPISTPPICDGHIPSKTDVICQPLSDDFHQYWLGASLFIEDGGNGADGEPSPIVGTGAAFGSTDWTLNGGTSADNHHPNPVRGTTQSLLTTSSLLPKADYPQFTSAGPAMWDTGAGGGFAPHTGSRYAYSDRSDVSYKRLTSTFPVPGGDTQLSLWMSRDTEPDWDYVFVEAHTPGQDDWVTLPEIGGITSNATGDSCAEGWFELHPWLQRYEGADCSGVGWNAVSGRSPGWQRWRVDLSAWAGKNVEVSISYASDWAEQGLGVFVDDIDAPGTVADTGFEGGLGAWSVAGPAPGSSFNPNDWSSSTDVGYVEAAVTSMAPPDASFRTLYFGFGFEGITTAGQRNQVMNRAMGYLLGP